MKIKATTKLVVILSMVIAMSSNVLAINATYYTTGEQFLFHGSLGMMCNIQREEHICICLAEFKKVTIHLIT